MGGSIHRYEIGLAWTGNLGTGTSGYRAYSRDHDLSAAGKPTIQGSSDPAFRGDPKRWNPEEMLVASLAACHQLWYLHLCSAAGIVVLAYEDRAEGEMEEDASGAGRFVRAILAPTVTIASGCDPATAERLHDEAHAMCFIARSMAFPVNHAPRIVVAPQEASSGGEGHGLVAG